MGIHEGQLDISVELATRLIRSQLPEFADVSVAEFLSEGTDNKLFRIGEEFVARFPIKQSDSDEMLTILRRAERSCLELNNYVLVDVPEIVAIGVPDFGYPLPWSVRTWLPGVTISNIDISDSVPFAEEMAEFVLQVRSIPVGDRTFSGKGRGGVLSSHDDWMEICFENSEDLLNVPVLKGMWSEFRVLEPPEDFLMCHCDLIPGNILSMEGSFSGVIDVGGLKPADPALDLVVCWHLFNEQPRQAIRNILQCGNEEWERGKAWAFQQAMGLVWYYTDTNPTMSKLGQQTLSRLQQ